jgi:hypothetical protein
VGNPNLTKVSVGTQWKPGQSGNPGGVAHALAIVREQLRPLLPGCGDRLAILLDHDDPYVRLAAIREVYDRVCGKPKSVDTADQVHAEMAKIFSGLRSALSPEQYADLVEKVANYTKGAP